jgi:hypothetical protein
MTAGAISRIDASSVHSRVARYSRLSKLVLFADRPVEARCHPRRGDHLEHLLNP